MKKINFFYCLTILLTIVNCAPKITMNSNFYKPDSKVGIILIKDSIKVYKTGGQGLLDMAVTSGKKYNKALQEKDNKINFSEDIYNYITKTFKLKNKSYIIIENKYGIEKFNYLKISDSKLKTDIKNFKPKYNIDQLMVVYLTYGLQITYQGMIEIGKEGMAKILTSIINLNDNSIL